MEDFVKYLARVKEQLDCNATEDYKANYVTYTYSNEEVDNNLDYFKNCMKNGMGEYISLLLFYDFIHEI